VLKFTLRHAPLNPLQLAVKRDGIKKRGKQSLVDK
jgi:hypothetical protein